ncbi:MAG: SDR family oxidoreductase [Porticoccus sp.]|nr:SDR family oxidoreductase [Porticoccus sp.]
MNILVTGASGFVGQALVSLLSTKTRIRVCAAARSKLEDLPSNSRCVEVGDISSVTDWTDALRAMQIVVHTAARVHIMNDSAEDTLTEFRKVNVEGTLNLARQAVEAGVRRFMFISSVKVNGERTYTDTPFLADAIPRPMDAYGVSKYEAEVGLYRLAEETDMEIVVIRPPLVYGPRVKGNFASMVRILEKGIPLPFGAIHNKRSLVALDNLLDLIVTCIDHPDAANQTFLAGDGEDMSTTELLKRLGKALGKPARLIPLPGNLLTFVAVLLGKKSVAQRLYGSLQVDISKAREVLGWEPPITVDEGLRRAVEDFKA